MRPEYSNIPLATLVDLLAQETQKFTHLMTFKQFGKDYDDSKKKIHEITAAIENHPEKSGSPNKRYNSPDPSSSFQ